MNRLEVKNFLWHDTKIQSKIISHPIHMAIADLAKDVLEDFVGSATMGQITHLK